MKDFEKSIGEIGNYYGGLSIKKEGEKYFWSIENYDGDNWYEIPKYVFNTLIKYQEEFKAEQDTFL